MSFISQQSKLFGFSIPLYPIDSYTGTITNVPEDATEILSLKGEMIDFTNITQYSDIVLHSDDNYSVRIRREDTYIHLEILEVSTNQTGILWWTGFGNTYRWWICASIDDVSGDIYLFAVSDANHTWINRGMNDHSPMSGTGSTGLLVKRFFKYTQTSGGGAGSGYIGNTLVGNKKMIGYNVPTSSTESTKTESISEYSDNPVSGKPKIGNGFARIKFLRSCWGGEEVAILWAGDSNKMTVQISNSNILFKLYTGDTVIYSFTAYAGSTILDADNIYVHFLIESEQQLAKPSMVYANGSVLSYNQEEPTDAEMADIYTWLSAGLPSA